MQEKYRKHIKNLQNLQTVLVLFCIVASLAYIFIVTRPKVVLYNYADECGLMPGGSGVSHTLKNEDTCSNACYSYCISKDYKFQKAVFEVREGPQCNLCECHCLD